MSVAFIIGLFSALFVGGALLGVINHQLDFTFRGDIGEDRKAMRALADKHRVQCVICKSNVGGGLKTFKEFDHEPVCFPCQCKVGFFGGKDGANPRPADQKNWYRFRAIKQECQDKHMNWVNPVQVEFNNRPEVDTLDAKLAATLASAQQAVFDSWALVNPLRLQIWKELNTPPEEAKIEVEDPVEELPEPIVWKEPNKGIHQEQLQALQLLAARDHAHTVERKYELEQQKTETLQKELAKQRRENRKLHLQLDHEVTDVYSFGDSDPITTYIRETS